MKRLLVLLAASLVASPAAAAVDLDAMHGVWKGTIGALPIRACYDAAGSTKDGKYYYERFLKTIPLKADDAMPGDLTEGWADTKGVARWTITAISADRAEGAWRGNGKTLPIRLTRLPFTADEDMPNVCSSLAFSQPIIAAGKIVRNPARAQGIAIERWQLVHPDSDGYEIRSFQLPGNDAATAAINRHLRKPFDDADEGWKWCVRFDGSWGGQYLETIEPTLATNRWLAINKHNESYCGGAHPNNSNVHTLFDRRTGSVVNLMDWMLPAMVHREKVEGFEETLDSLAGALSRYVVAKHPRNAPDDEECAEVIKTAEWWSLDLRRDGIAFIPELPRVVMACGDELVVSFRDLQPFLNATGKREVAALQAELAKR